MQPIKTKNILHEPVPRGKIMTRKISLEVISHNSLTWVRFVLTIFYVSVLGFCDNWARKTIFGLP